jgi:hypothetical protein|tara:strand:- start:9954 stop:10955 length:1002 start_codon:yes stop_codon:yes gene_type:complete
MAKFTNKKEQVFDLQLTSYAKYMLSIGKFKPAFYAFFDDNVVYDKRYTFTSATEEQSDIDKRIKDETQYIETLVLFKDLEKTKSKNLDSSVDFVLKGRTARETNPDSDVFKIENAIGDAYLDGPAQMAPSWKVATLSSKITASANFDTTTQSRIPQVDIVSTYVKKIVNNDFIFDPQNLRNVTSRSPSFADQKVIELMAEDPVVYVEEVNTRALMRNFDIEVFRVDTNATARDHAELTRLTFKRETSNVQNEFLVNQAPTTTTHVDFTNENIEYYFDVLLDSDVNQRIACKGLDLFNKESYYIDIDFDCFGDDETSYYYDIYGSSTEPEICQD